MSDLIKNLCDRIESLTEGINQTEGNADEWARHAIDELTEITEAMNEPHRHCVHGVPLDKRCEKCF